jgi:uncharacterized membrane protein YecN with MAPEG domain
LELGIRTLINKITMANEPTILLNIVPFYGGILGLIYAYLAFAVISVRRREQLALGDGEIPELRRKIRAHGNFNEYTPITLLLIAFLELQHGTPFVIHLLCSALLIGRGIHAWSISSDNENVNYRIAGMILTFLPLIGTSLILVFSQ